MGMLIALARPRWRSRFQSRSLVGWECTGSTEVSAASRDSQNLTQVFTHRVGPVTASVQTKSGWELGECITRRRVQTSNSTIETGFRCEAPQLKLGEIEAHPNGTAITRLFNNLVLGVVGLVWPLLHSLPD